MPFIPEFGPIVRLTGEVIEQVGAAAKRKLSGEAVDVLGRGRVPEVVAARAPVDPTVLPGEPFLKGPVGFRYGEFHNAYYHPDARPAFIRQLGITDPLQTEVANAAIVGGNPRALYSFATAVNKGTANVYEGKLPLLRSAVEANKRGTINANLWLVSDAIPRSMRRGR